MLGPIISENDPPFFAPWVTSPHQSWIKWEALAPQKIMEPEFSQVYIIKRNLKWYSMSETGNKWTKLCSTETIWLLGKSEFLMFTDFGCIFWHILFSLFLCFCRCAKFVFISLNRMQISELLIGKKKHKLKRDLLPILSHERWKSQW